MFQSFLYEQPSSIITVISIVPFLFLSFSGIFEIFGKHLQYSKFWNMNPNSTSNYNNNNVLQVKLSSRTGMLIVYAPACIMVFATFFLYPDGGTRFMMVKYALTIHFLKRVLEVLFVHKFSGKIVLGTVLSISSAYILVAAVIPYNHHLIQGYTEPEIDLKYTGLLLFLVGTSGNFYHHYILSKLRDNIETGYKIPQGGLFNLVICPHYLFEILVLLGLSFISQTPIMFYTTVGSSLYLMGRSYVTRKWYLSKFENFPKSVKALIPFVF